MSLTMSRIILKRNFSSHFVAFKKRQFIKTLNYAKILPLAKAGKTNIHDELNPSLVSQTN